MSTAERRGAAGQARPSLRGLVRRLVRRLYRIATGDPGATRPFISNVDRIRGLDQVRSIDPTARLFVRDPSPRRKGYIALGRDVYLGRSVEIATMGTGHIGIGDDTSLQDFCVIHGDVTIGAHCLFSMFVLVGTTTHRFRDRPEWLIRDQDLHIQAHPEVAVDPVSKPIIIEDDCWIGYGVVIMPGVYVGRGAVIGANCVATTDVGPYEIHGGVPNRKIGVRLDFAPPRAVTADSDAALPYFYRGFLVGQDDLMRSRLLGIVKAAGHTCIVLSDAPGASLLISGIALDQSGALTLKLRINGVPCGTHPVMPGEFEFAAEVPARSGGAASTEFPRVMQQYTYIEIEAVSEHPARDAFAGPPRYGIMTARLSDGSGGTSA